MNTFNFSLWIHIISHCWDVLSSDYSGKTLYIIIIIIHRITRSEYLKATVHLLISIQPPWFRAAHAQCVLLVGECCSVHRRPVLYLEQQRKCSHRTTITLASPFHCTACSTRMSLWRGHYCDNIVLIKNYVCNIRFSRSTLNHRGHDGLRSHSKRPEERFFKAIH